MTLRARTPFTRESRDAHSKAEPPSVVRVHDLRHTVASRLIANGESLAYVKEQMGHSSIKITVDTYGHLIPGANRAAVDRLDSTGRHPSARSIGSPGWTRTSDILINSSTRGANPPILSRSALRRSQRIAA